MFRPWGVLFTASGLTFVVKVFRDSGSGSARLHRDDDLLFSSYRRTLARERESSLRSQSWSWGVAVVTSGHACC